MATAVIDFACVSRSWRKGRAQSPWGSFVDLYASSREVQEVLKQVRIVAPTDTTVLITGETGTGKKLIANAIHTLSKRREAPFIKLNCAVFGHERGAFTAAVTQRLGRFEAANGGTLFLDKVGDMPLNLQAKLLRVLQEQEFERLGSSQTRRVDIRVVAATNHNLAEAVAQKQFRIGLVLPAEHPPAAEDSGDCSVALRAPSAARNRVSLDLPFPSSFGRFCLKNVPTDLSNEILGTFCIWKRLQAAKRSELMYAATRPGSPNEIPAYLVGEA